MMRGVAIPLLAVLLADPALAAVEPGTRVRVTVLAKTPTKLIGNVLAAPPDTLVLSIEPDSSQKAIPFASITQLEVSEGMQSNTWKGAYSCAILFAVPGAVLGLVAGETGKGEGGDANSPSKGAFGGFVIGALAGGALGALLGSLGHHERWKKVEP